MTTQNIPENTILKTSPDLLEERITNLKKLMPDLFDGDGNLDESALRDLTESYNLPRAEKFTFNWSGKQGSKRIAFEPSKATLKANLKASKNLDTTKNLLIEGDNLEVLKLLQKSYYEKVKCIYIDPPYNTGKDFIYPDNYGQTRKEYWQESGAVDSEGIKLESNPDSSGKYHSNWLNMMQPRLLLARNLMREDGVIFVSIDDHEVHNLRKLMDEVFGEENFVGVFIKQSKVGGGSDSKFVVKEHEYVMCFAKYNDQTEEFFVKHSESNLTRYREQDEKGRYFWDTYARPGLFTGVGDSLFYEIEMPDGSKLQNRWRRSMQRFFEDLNNSIVSLNKKVDGSWSVLFKQYLNENGKKPRSMTMDFGGTIDGKNSIIELFESDKMFSYPKSPKFIKTLLNILNDNTGIILDFFAGSGTTAQAVMELNAEDGGNRQFILVQIPEKTQENSEANKAGYKTIFDISAERIRRAGDKIITKLEPSTPRKITDSTLNPSVDVGFRVLSLSDSHFPENTFDQDPELTEAENLANLQLYLEQEKQSSLLDVQDVDGLILEIALKQGYDLSYNISKVKDFGSNTVYLVKDETQQMLLCLDTTITSETVEELANHKEINFVCLKSALDTTNKWNIERTITKDRLFVM